MAARCFIGVMLVDFSAGGRDNFWEVGAAWSGDFHGTDLVTMNSAKAQRPMVHMRMGMSRAKRRSTHKPARNILGRVTSPEP